MLPIRHSILLIVSILFFSHSDAQKIGVNSFLFNNHGYNYIGNEFWASGGAGIAEQGSAVTVLSNPAVIHLDGITISTEMIHRNKTDFLFSDMEYDNKLVLPSFVSIGIPLEDFTITAGYANTYNEQWNFGEIAVTTSENPYGTGATYTAGLRTLVHTAFVSLTAEPIENFSTGITMGVDFIENRNEMFYSWTKANGTKFSVLFGSWYKYSEKVQFGLTLNIPTTATLNIESNIPDGSVIEGGIGSLQSSHYLAASPLTVSFGTALIVSSSMTLLLSADYQNWDGAMNYALDVWQYHAGITATLSPEFSVRMGIFSNNYPIPDARSYFDQTFITTGIAIRILPGYTVALTYLSSEPFTVEAKSWDVSKSFSQSAFSGGVSVSF
jgi:hypothetical protein